VSVFRYQAIAVAGDALGTLASGELSADCAADVRARLRQAGMQVVSLAAVEDISLPAWLPVREFFERHLRHRRVALVDEVLDGLATLLESGVPLTESLETLQRSEVAEHAALRRMLAGLAEAVRSGGSLGDAMRSAPAWFDPVAVAIVETGEHGGALAQALRGVAKRHARSDEVAQKILSALAYPAIVSVVGISVWLFLSTKTLPEFVRILSDGKVPVPRVTQIVMGAGQWILANGWMVVVLFALAAAAWIGARGRLADSLPPIVKRLEWSPVVLRRLRLARFATTLSELLGHGVPLVEALRVLAPTAGHPRFAALIRAGAARIERGEQFSDTVDEERWFPAEFRRLIEMGEQSGELTSLLSRLGARLERSSERRVDRLTALLEPAVILTLAVLIGVVAMAAVLPMTRLQDLL
jgi:type II secretory pathway component PulF